MHTQLGLDRDALTSVLHDAYDDLEPGARLDLPDTCPVDEFILRDIIGAIDDLELQQRLLRPCVGIAHSDGTLDNSESIIISSAMAPQCTGGCRVHG